MADDRVRIASVMSVPLCGWNPHWGCHSAALAPMGVEDQIVVYGAWWDHGISNAFEDLIERGMDWILTMDYDSMFTAEHVSALFERLGQNAEIDALAAMQPRRGTEETPLMTVESDTEIEFGEEAIKATSAHFGLTLFRVEAFAKVKKPWFMNLPDADGSYRTLGRKDADMYFWDRWREAGNTLFVDPHIRIGHLQPMVAEMYRDDADGHLRTRHVHFMDWRKRVNKVTEEVAA